MSGKKGSRYERELVNRFESLGWGALRCPASGGATNRELPDILAGLALDGPSKNYPIARALAIELKSGDATTLYVDKEEVYALRSFAQSFGATPLLGARFTTQASSTDIYLVQPEHARMTPKAYGLPLSDIEDRTYMRVSKHGVQKM